MSLSEGLKEKVLDIRLREKLLREGKLTKSELESYLSSLPDDEGNSEPLYKESEQ
tara:strand:+ start:1305 stop:1469 length:165 start_codon:yes stop_codon:yes gene_type:complete